MRFYIEEKRINGAYSYEFMKVIFILFSYEKSYFLLNIFIVSNMLNNVFRDESSIS